MSRIPAICSNPACAFIFPSAFELNNSSDVTFSNCTSGFCPRCGSIGNVPNGTYDSIGDNIFAKLFNIRDIETLKQIEQSLKNKQTEKLPDDIKEAVSSFEKLNKNLPLLTFILFFIHTLILVLSYAKDAPAPANITNQTIINQTFNQLYSLPYDEPPIEHHKQNRKDHIKLEKL